MLSKIPFEGAGTFLKFGDRDFMVALGGSKTEPLVGKRPPNEQFLWLLDRIDPASSFEREFLQHLHQHQLRLPDEAQSQPESSVYAQPDFYYLRNGIPGVCVFVDGPAHDAPGPVIHDQQIREALEDRGYRVISIRPGSFAEQVARYPDTFGAI